MTHPIPLTDIEFLTEFADYCRGRIAQFLRDTGRATNPAVNELRWRDLAVTCAPDADRTIPAGLDEAVRDWPTIFSALSKRVEQIITPCHPPHNER